jgi:hypothetical protein
MENKTATLATKEDLHKLDLKFENRFGELKAEIGNVKFDLLKWIIILWVTNTAMIIGLYFRN